jgi:hypothetical protein
MQASLLELSEWRDVYKVHDGTKALYSHLAHP